MSEKESVSAESQPVVPTRDKSSKYSAFHGDPLMGVDHPEPTTLATALALAKKPIVTLDFLQAQIPIVKKIVSKIPIVNKILPGDQFNALTVFSNAPEGSFIRKLGSDGAVKRLWDPMLHPPLSYLSDQFQYRTADGSYNSVQQPNLGRGGTPYAKSVEPKANVLGAKPDPGDIFDLLMARDDRAPARPERYQQSGSGLSSMLLYHATIIIHDIFRTNQKDMNITDTSSYLDLTPLYGHTQEIQDKVRTHKDGLLWPDTFAEDRLLRQPPGVCILLIMYNRYHNYCARELKKINEGGRFSLPPFYYADVDEDYASQTKRLQGTVDALQKRLTELPDAAPPEAREQLQQKLDGVQTALADHTSSEGQQKFRDQREKDKEAALKKQDYDLFNTARLITSGLYVNISVQDYLKALMGLHASHNSSWVLDPRTEIGDDRQANPRGIGNQISVEFNLLYRFHCAISARDEKWTHDFLAKLAAQIPTAPGAAPWKFEDLPLDVYQAALQAAYAKDADADPKKAEFGGFKRTHTGNSEDGAGVFSDKQLVEEVIKVMNDPIGQFGPLNTPKDFRVIEMMAIMQSRKWGIATLNEFREFFKLKPHKTFADISKNPYVQDKLQSLYDHPDKVELYPGAFCEGTATNKLDPGDEESSPGSTLWGAIFSDAVTLVRSDRFYTVDWNVQSLTTWGMNEVSPNNSVLKGSVFHRLIQRAFPGYFPYDNIALSQPFYTPAKNEAIAKVQGYVREFDTTPLTVERPRKTWIIKQHKNVTDVLDPAPAMAQVYVNRTAIGNVDIPEVITEAIKNRDTRSSAFDSISSQIDRLKPLLLTYFTQMSEDILVRERLQFGKNTGKMNTTDYSRGKKNWNKVYSVDITRDVANAVVTRFVADVLGFGHLMKTAKNPKGEYSENYIYKHITNIHVYISVNEDETKMLERRQAFVESIKFLFGLTKNAVGSAIKWSWVMMPEWLRDRNIDPHVARIRNFGTQVALELYHAKGGVDEAAAALLVAAVYGAYNSVIMFTEVLAFFLPTAHAGLYDKDGKKVDGDPENPPPDFETDGGTVHPSGAKYWTHLQDMAEPENNPANDIEIEKFVLEAQRLVMKIPVTRDVTKQTIALETPEPDRKGKASESTLVQQYYEAGDTVILNINAASKDPVVYPNPYKFDPTRDPAKYLTFGVNSRSYKTKQITIMALTGLIKASARLRNLRRGHDTQGKLKSVGIDSLGPGYFNYLTSDWSEYTPFPTTWKVRFDGPSPGKGVEGEGKVNSNNANILYQGWGPSHTGGTFTKIDGMDSDDFKQHVERVVKAMQGGGDGDATAGGPPSNVTGGTASMSSS